MDGEGLFSNSYITDLYNEQNARAHTHTHTIFNYSTYSFMIII